MSTTPKPVYIIAHNPNSLKEVDEVLALGVNGLEPDVHYNPATRDLCISHDMPGEDDDPPTVPGYLNYVKQQLRQYPGLSLLLFDIKLEDAFYNEVPLADWGTRLHNMVNEVLGDEGLLIIYSVSKVPQCPIFSEFGHKLNQREALMVDQESDVEDVMKAFDDIYRSGMDRLCYADGCYAYLPDFGIADHVEKAIARRAATGQPKYVSSWVLHSEDTIRKYFQMGVNGMIVTNDRIETARAVVASSEMQSAIRLAVRTDNPFL